MAIISLARYNLKRSGSRRFSSVAGEPEGGGSGTTLGLHSHCYGMFALRTLLGVCERVPAYVFYSYLASHRHARRMVIRP